MKKINVSSIADTSNYISAFSEIGEIYVLEYSFAIEVHKILEKHKTKKFKIAINEHEQYANIWRTK